ncbi:MAG: hypothetical protein C7B46_11510 [Sulfobacillus benefaciens]|uniref:Uncharacterized protein n=1 Tax=Sulfobacillus benefaciens TaxID=453960 RepID=A0A2T2XEX0_9FIRM|nr:MAG: hypothetical protein C7B46_11510 [Sulfobacillus benefaciens]
MLETPPDLGPPNLAENSPGSPDPEAPAATTAWTPDVVKMLISGLWTMLVAWRGPHWALTPEETDPLWEPTTITLNNTPGLKNFAPEHMAIAITVAGWGTIAAKRAGWDRELAQARQKSPRQSERAQQDSGGSPYGPNRMEG